MYKQASVLFASLCAVCSSPLQGDLSAPQSEADLPSLPIENITPLVEPTEELVLAKKPKIKENFKPFTGKVKGKKVRLRLQPDVDSFIVKEVSRGELLAIVEETDDFWAVESPRDLKAYVFRSFVLDGHIEGNRVNVRLQPSLEAPIIAHLSSGDPVSDGVICSINNKWIEFSIPATTRFYISKDFIENIGGPEQKVLYETRLLFAKQQLETAEYFVENEMQKDYPNIDLDKMSHSFQVVIQEYHEFTDLVERAKESLTKVQEDFLDKRIAYLELKERENGELIALSKKPSDPSLENITDKMKLWEPIEEALYLSWFSANDSKNMDEYYEDQKLTATKISGILELYTAPVKCKPGSYIIRHKDLPVGYVYSTVINLEHFIGKQVTLLGAPRPNNHFAFPAYFIFSVEN